MMLSKKKPANHVVLLGDSIFDNASYVDGGPDVIQHLRQCLPARWQATLNAVDGSITSDVSEQLQALPRDASFLVLSIGGNDVLGFASLLDESANSVTEALTILADAHDTFQKRYRAMLDGVMRKNLPVAVCTIYDGRFPEPERRRIAAAALTVFNDCITREAFARGLPLIDLRLICNEDTDFANPIEPSVLGGAKIAAVIEALLADYDSARPRSEIFVK